CPPRAPKWFSHAHGHLGRQNLGAHFNSLVAAWIRIEAASRFEHSGALLKKLRPEQVNRWIQDARGQRNRPDPPVNNPVEYEHQWWAWWDSLQPAWRGKDAAGSWKVTEPYGKDWGDPLLVWGQNGVLSVVAALYFWGCAVQNDEELLGKWEAAVNDAAWMFE
ncbi:hypothetical protein C8R46DRAFT_863722, partial [Mycena filopes]